MPSKRYNQINQRLSEIRNELLDEAPYCVFCGTNRNLTLMHLIRRSYSLYWQDKKDNCVLGCIRCHEIFDNKKGEGLPNIETIKRRIKELDEQYYNLTYEHL